MLQYLIRRIILAIPTFFGATFVVFSIARLAPGGPYEEELNKLINGQNSETGGGSAVRSAAVSFSPEVLEQLRRKYQVDESIFKRYGMWLGVYPRPVNDNHAVIDSALMVDGGERVVVKKKSDGQLAVFDADNQATELDGWSIDPSKASGSVWIYQTKVSGILTLDFGTSRAIEDQKPVIELISDKLPISMQFGLVSFVITYVVCFYLGTRKALGHGTPFDVISSSIVFIAFSVPGWAIGAVMLVLFGLGGLELLSDVGVTLPAGNIQSDGYDDLSLLGMIGDRAVHFLLPILSYTLGGFASVTMLMKNSLLETLGQDYIRTAYAKGLREERVIWVHAMRNSVIPLVASIGGIIGIFLAGNYLVETAFNIDGIGYLSISAVTKRDFDVFFAFAVISIIITLIGSIISDFLLALVDPRIRF